MSTRAVQHAPAARTNAPAVLPVTDVVSIGDLGPAGVQLALELASLVKARPSEFRTALAGKQLVLMFEKPSLRTRLTFEAGIAAMGGTSFFIDHRGERMAEREPVRDIARNLERWIDGVVLRTFEHSTVTEMAEFASIPVINALSDFEHPCQALADFLTLQEKLGDLRKIKIAYVGDGNNVAHSLLLAAACVGASVAIGTPKGYEPSADVVKQARAIARETGAKIEPTHDPKAAVAGADAVYTDVWASMGQEDETEARRRIFAAFQVNGELTSYAKTGALFMHCLPAHRGDEVTESVFESSQSIVFDQAENRLHAQKAVLLMLFSDGVGRFVARKKSKSPARGWRNAHA
jgi:ornithine carbamoyltransferase